MALQEQAARANLPQIWRPFAIALAVVIGDRITKELIRDHFSGLDSVSVIPGLIRIIHVENPGAAFGMLAEGNPLLRAVILIGLSSAVLLFVAATLYRQARTVSAFTRVGLSFVLGGAIGNLYDRILSGTVTDFIEVYHGTWSFPAFNVADSAITVGAAFLLLDFLMPKRTANLEQSATPPGK